MANKVIYAELSPEERVHYTSQTANAGEQITYAEVKRRRRSDTPESAPKTTHQKACSENAQWCYIAIILYFFALILFITVILLAVKC